MFETAIQFINDDFDMHILKYTCTSKIWLYIYIYHVQFCIMHHQSLIMIRHRNHEWYSTHVYTIDPSNKSHNTSENITQCTILQQKCAQLYPFCYKNGAMLETVHTCTHLCNNKMVHCEIRDWCIGGFVRQVQWLATSACKSCIIIHHLILYLVTVALSKDNDVFYAMVYFDPRF